MRLLTNIPSPPLPLLSRTPATVAPVPVCLVVGETKSVGIVRTDERAALVFALPTSASAVELLI